LSSKKVGIKKNITINIHYGFTEYYALENGLYSYVPNSIEGYIEDPFKEIRLIIRDSKSPNLISSINLLNFKYDGFVKTKTPNQGGYTRVIYKLMTKWKGSFEQLNLKDKEMRTIIFGLRGYFYDEGIDPYFLRSEYVNIYRNKNTIELSHSIIWYFYNFSWIK
jgi:hypothetical protein